MARCRSAGAARRDDLDAPSPFRSTVDELAEDEEERKDKTRH